MKVLVIDNYDSFTYNLVHLLEGLGAEVIVKRNDQFEMDEVEEYQKVLLSPGPGLPKDAGQLLEVIQRYAETKSIMGVCLGHQALAESFGGTLSNLSEVYHGVDCELSVIAEDKIYNGLPKSFKVGRYHSWAVDKNVPDVFEVTATDENGMVMSMRHKTLDLTGVQYHPESVLTENGRAIMENWLRI